ncbi:hypothetical protein MML48_7g00004133 [Holotrichia oblita]|uniref:Uncharacterized protein n=1 Tax=Holotrichia oblita TaxID=644536 RepID=A0ACB9SSA2_HOLOL|nr:hypothetical protein MML48_7g00004133 [Holotrichia oblita]
MQVIAIKKLSLLPNYSVNKVFTYELDQELKEYIIMTSKIHHGLTKKKCRLLAYKLAMRNKEYFLGEDYLCSYVSDRPVIQQKHSEQHIYLPQNGRERQLAKKSLLVGTFVLKPLQRAKGRKLTNRPRKKSRVLTDTPVKYKIEEEKEAGKIVESESKKTYERQELQNDSLSSAEYEDITYQDTDTESVSDDDILLEEKELQKKIGQFVLICEGKGRNNKGIYSVGEITDIQNDITVHYIKRFHPFS